MTDSDYRLHHSEDYYIRTLLNKAIVREIMTKDVICLKEDDIFSLVAETFQQKAIRHLPIIDSKGRVRGIITQRDLYRISPPRKTDDGQWYYDKRLLDGYILKYVMTKDVTVLNESKSVAEALLLMVDHKYGCLPIVNAEGKLSGIVTQIDILRLGAQILREGKKNTEKKFY